MKVYIQVTFDRAIVDDLYYVELSPRRRWQVVKKTEHLITLRPEGGIRTRTITGAQFDKDVYYFIGRQKMTDQQALEKAIAHVDSGALGREDVGRDKQIEASRRVFLVLDRLEDMFISEGMSEEEAESAALEELDQYLSERSNKKKRSKPPKKKA